MDDPVPGPEEVLLRPYYCSVTDPGQKSWKYSGKIKPGTIIGHEFSAEVVSTGSEVVEWKVGDIVVASSIIPCFKCLLCREGKNYLCDDAKTIGFTVNGGFSELVVLPSTVLYPVPASITLKDAVLVSSLAKVLHGFNKVGLKPGQTILVIGAGIIGLLAVQVARICGASLVVVADPNPSCRNLAGRLGAMHMIDPVHSSLHEEFERATNSPTADVVVETTGVAAFAAQIFSMTRKGGKSLILGDSDTNIPTDFKAGVLKELTIHFSHRGCFEIPAALELMSKGIIDTSSLIAKEIRMEEVIDRGLHYFFEDLPNCAKLLVKI